MQRLISSLRQLRIIALLLILSGCAALGAYKFDEVYGKASVQTRITTAETELGKFYTEQVKPVLDSRCVSCHACYDAPCQLKLTSPQGIDRGATSSPVYSGTRLIAADPSRLFIDHINTEEWREHGFYPVLNERQQSSEANKSGSLIHQVLELKEHNPLPENTVLPASDYDFSLNRDNSCPSIETFEQYAQKNPQAGMPYGLPGITPQEKRILTSWIESGGQMVLPEPLDESILDQVQQWELFLNQDTKKEQLVSRYLYEHLFLADLFFESANSDPTERHYFELVRSTTPPGQPIEIIPTRRPTGDPKVDRPFYRLQPITTTTVNKTFLPYRLNPQRMAWIKQLFIEPEYSVEVLPDYQKNHANPFRTFKAIPAASRYHFLLEEAKFYIEGFIKGPVCRGQVAVDVINDHFWVFFINPNENALPMLDGFLEQQLSNLRLPGEQGSNAGLLSYWTTYSKLHQEYLLAKADGLKKIFNSGYSLNLNLIWDGNDNNDNSALTVFRNSDNAAVVKGLIGPPPKTTWIVDYPLLERIHYLLTVDFDVYGNIGHQLNTRLYMDFLRIEGEYNFLALMPPEQRFALRDFWYRGADQRLSDHLHTYEAYLAQTPDIHYTTDNAKEELYQLIQKRLANTISTAFSLDNPKVPAAQRQPLEELQNISGIPSSLLAEITNLYVLDDSGHATLYTVFANRARSNITSLLAQHNDRLPGEDTISVTFGIAGDYPNAFWSVTEQQLNEFVSGVESLKTEEDYQRLMDRFGIRRSSTDFWQHSDKVHAQYLLQQPDFAGRMDYNRLENR